MVLKLRRLAADHAALHSKLPPYYLLQPDDGHFAAADDLSQVTILLTGPPGTPYSEGLWRLQLKIPEDYPNSPPKATFRTRIWHPNVEEMTGAVCVDTLKRDWQSKLTLRDVLITISCLLINPNPDSALNSSAGNLLREDYNVFAHQAKLMTSIHAPIQPALQDAVNEAKHRGEDPGTMHREPDTQHQRPRKQQRIQTGTTMKNNRPPSEYIPHPPRDIATHAHPVPEDDPMQMSDVDDENDDLESASKENNPSLSPTPVRLAPPSSPRKNAFGKRPLSVLSLAYPEDPDTEMMLVDSDSEPENGTDTPATNMSFSSSDKNIAANTSSSTFSRYARHSPSMSPQRKNPKLALSRRANTPTRFREDVQIYEDVPDRTLTDISRRFGGDGKENRDSVVPRALKDIRGLHAERAAPPANTQAMQSGHPPNTTTSSVSKQSPSKVSKKVLGLRKGAMPKVKPRIGLRRL
ncbi:Ubiquitin-conjugating enzyme E2 [Penicillium longicatenatum]|uniref:Ubiquitin-conjugating enzyme E2 n=1 Tax=Penicillium longicatenatum TaxID=1561947 RepID=UPI0025487576|nr:Ubiquitin-conjugating enzyme E2 [Penicillium longicatenatum]KAJ5658636.1 Ubiquitin-conjugating enzyme E2 [Penicillium longicatenatum]